MVSTDRFLIIGMSAVTAEKHTESDEDHGHHEHYDPFWKKYLFSTDHKVIGLQYGSRPGWTTVARWLATFTICSGRCTGRSWSSSELYLLRLVPSETTSRRYRLVRLTWHSPGWIWPVIGFTSWVERWCLSVSFFATNLLNFERSNFEIIWENSVIFAIRGRVFVVQLKDNLRYKIQPSFFDFFLNV